LFSKKISIQNPKKLKIKKKYEGGSLEILNLKFFIIIKTFEVIFNLLQQQ